MYADGQTAVTISCCCAALLEDRRGVRRDCGTKGTENWSQPMHGGRDRTASLGMLAPSTRVRRPPERRSREDHAGPWRTAKRQATAGIP